MNVTSPEFDWTTFLHAGYVAFVFGVLFFGALAFRQILDSLAVKNLAMGEDKDSFLDAAAAVTVAIGWVALVPAVIFCYGIVEPSIYVYSVPLILGVQVLQITMRIWFQRTQVKTRGLIVRSVLFDRVISVAYAEIVVVRFVKGRVWTEVRVGLSDKEVGFRIFSFSAQSLERMIEGATRAPVLWSSGIAEHLPSSEYHP